MNKGGQGLSVATIIVIVLAVVVLVFLIYGFSVGWENLYDRVLNLGGEINVGSVVTACELVCSTENKFDYCIAKRDVRFEKGEDTESLRCVDLESKGVGLQKCDIQCEEELIVTQEEGEIEKQEKIYAAVETIRRLKGKYSDNKDFIDGLYSQGLISKKDYNDIRGEGGIFDYLAFGLADREEDVESIEEILLGGGSLCTLVRGNGNPKNLDILFMGQDFRAGGGSIYFYNKETLYPRRHKSFQEFVEEDAEIILNHEIFSDYRERINIWRLNQISDFGCKIKGNTCVSSWAAIEREMGNCQADSVVVVFAIESEESEHSEIRAIAHIGNDAAILPHPMKNRFTLIHELGHSFGGLHDEYVYGDSLGASLIKKDSLNCVLDSMCRQFGELAEGCFQGCTVDERYRSIETGVMRSSNSEEFGAYNEKIIRDKLRRYG